MKNLIRKIAAIIVIVATIVVSVNSSGAKAASKKKPKLNKKSVTLTMTNKKKTPTVTLKVKNADKKVSWKSSNKKVATIKATGKYNAKITAKKAGKANITCKVSGKKLVCKITVNDNSTKCNHNWIEHWTVYEHEGDYDSNTCACQCGIFKSSDEFDQHLFTTSVFLANYNHTNKERKAGIHGTKAKYMVSMSMKGTVSHITIKTEYIDYYQCTKCNIKTDTTWDGPKEK